MSETEGEKFKRIQEMRGWFFGRYEDPVHSLPYDSQEGGYQFIWGGPVDARDALFSQFGDQGWGDEIEELVAELENQCTDWSPIPDPSEFSEGGTIESFLEVFERSLQNVKKELDRLDSHPNPEFITALLYAHLITALETYLHDVLIGALLHEEFLRKFIETDPEIGKQKFELREVYDTFHNVRKIASARVAQLVFHRLEIVGGVYRDTLGVQFPGNLGGLHKAIQRRNDIVHRSCKTKDGVPFLVTASDIRELLIDSERFIREVDSKLPDYTRTNF